MPIVKAELKRYQIIDEKLSDPDGGWTTAKIHAAVNRECENVSLRMIQKDINALCELYNGNDPKRKQAIVREKGTVRWADQSNPIFYKQLTDDEEKILGEMLGVLGKFEGLSNFRSLELLRKKLQVGDNEEPVISFSKNEGLQIPETLLGRLFTAISLKKVIRVTYTKFGGTPVEYEIYPYLLKQFNERWFLLCTPLANDQFPYDPEFIMPLALDRMSENFDYLDEEVYIQTPVDLKARFDEIIGVTLDCNEEVEDIYFAVKPASLPYVQTKWMHTTQLPLDRRSEVDFKKKYPSLSDCRFFSIECRPNKELYARFASYGENVVLVEPERMRNEMRRLINESKNNYDNL